MSKLLHYKGRVDPEMMDDFKSFLQFRDYAKEAFKQGKELVIFSVPMVPGKINPQVKYTDTELLKKIDKVIKTHKVEGK